MLDLCLIFKISVTSSFVAKLPKWPSQNIRIRPWSISVLLQCFALGTKHFSLWRTKLCVVGLRHWIWPLRDCQQSPMSSPFHSSRKIKTAIKKYTGTHTTELRVKKKKEVLLKPDTSPDMASPPGKRLREGTE